MNRKKYLKPTMEVVQLQHQSCILAGSDRVGSNASINNWGDGGTTDDEVEM